MLFERFNVFYAHDRGSASAVLTLMLMLWNGPGIYFHASMLASTMSMVKICNILSIIISSIDTDTAVDAWCE